MREKIGQNLFSTGKFGFFFKKLCFQQFLRCYRINTVTSTVNVRIPCGPSNTVPWGLSQSTMREKTSQKLFFTGKFAFFFKNLCFQQPLRCCRNDPKSSAAISICQITLWTRVRRSLRFVTLDNARRNRPKSFLHWKECIFFSKICVFNNRLGVKELIL